MTSLIRTLRHTAPGGLADAAQSAVSAVAGHRAARAVTATPAAPAARTLADATLTSARDVAVAARAVAFWLAIALPAVHLPLLLAWGLTERTARPLTVLWALHAFVLLVGARHGSRRD